MKLHEDPRVVDEFNNSLFTCQEDFKIDEIWRQRKSQIVIRKTTTSDMWFGFLHHVLLEFKHLQGRIGVMTGMPFEEARKEISKGNPIEIEIEFPDRSYREILNAFLSYRMHYEGMDDFLKTLG